MENEELLDEITQPKKPSYLMLTAGLFFLFFFLRGLIEGSWNMFLAILLSSIVMFSWFSEIKNAAYWTRKKDREEGNMFLAVLGGLLFTTGTVGLVALFAYMTTSDATTMLVQTGLVVGILAGSLGACLIGWYKKYPKLTTLLNEKSKEERR